MRARIDTQAVRNHFMAEFGGYSLLTCRVHSRDSANRALDRILDATRHVPFILSEFGDEVTISTDPDEEGLIDLKIPASAVIKRGETEKECWG